MPHEEFEQPFRCEILSSEFQDEIVRLRKSEFEFHYGSAVQTSGLNWNHTDEKSLHLGVKRGQQLLAALRVSFVHSKEAFRSILQTDFTQDQISRLGILARAVTHRDFQGRRLHSLLRYHALHICHSLQLNSVWGSCESNAKRLQQLQNLGYRFEKTYHWTDSYFRNRVPVVALLLDGNHLILQARQKLFWNLKESFQAEQLEPLILPAINEGNFL